MRRPSPILAAQFVVCEMTARSPAGEAVLVVVLQHNGLDALATVVVAPLLKEGPSERRPHIHPVVTYNGTTRFLFVERMAAIQRSELRAVVGSVADQAWNIKRAIDIVFFGF